MEPDEAANDGCHEALTTEECWRLFETFKSWADEGRHVKYYEYGNCFPFLCKMLDLDRRLSAEVTIERAAPGLLKGLLGPHAWAITQVLIIRYEDRHGIPRSSN